MKSSNENCGMRVPAPRDLDVHVIRHCLWGKFSGFRCTFQGRQEFLVRLTRGGRGTGMGGGPRWRRCCTGGGMFCCGRRRWWVCRVSTDLACLLQHLVYGVHACPHGIKRHSNAKAYRAKLYFFFSWFSNRAYDQVLNFLVTLICLLLPFLFRFGVDKMIRDGAR